MRGISIGFKMVFKTDCIKLFWKIYGISSTGCGYAHQPNVLYRYILFSSQNQQRSQFIELGAIEVVSDLQLASSLSFFVCVEYFEVCFEREHSARVCVCVCVLFSFLNQFSSSFPFDRYSSFALDWKIFYESQ